MSSELTKSQGGGNVKVKAFQTLWRGIEHSTPGTNALSSSDAMQELADTTDPADIDSTSDNKFVLSLIRKRQGQPAFRAALLQAYESRCAITEADTIEVLEAAHITPFSEGGPMTTDNGLLLRSDVHTLFDLGLIAVDTNQWALVVHQSMPRGTNPDKVWMGTS